MGRKKTAADTVVVSLRISEADWMRMREIAALETLNTGKIVTSHELIRQAIRFVYDDNERMRESFRRAKAAAAGGYKRCCQK